MIKVSLILEADAIKLPSACRICFVWTAVPERAQHSTQTEELADTLFSRRDSTSQFRLRVKHTKLQE